MKVRRQIEFMYPQKSDIHLQIEGNHGRYHDEMMTATGDYPV